MPKINFMRNEVKMQLDKWELISDCISGAEAVKGKGTRYLPMPNAHDRSTENKERYKAYVRRAQFMNATANTVDGLIGQVFSADPVVDIPDEMDILQEDADGNGVSLAQRAKKVLAHVLAFGRTGILVDFPEAMTDEQGSPRDFTRQEIMDGFARPSILQFHPKDIINWRTRTIGGKTLLSLVVIEMQYVIRDDGFEIEHGTEWRVLKLDESNQYVCEVWRKNEDANTSGQPPEPFLLHKAVHPVDYKGMRLRIIPFTFVGSLNNNESPDKPAIYDIAELNIGHYRNSADYEDSVYMVGQGTPVAIGITSSYMKDVWKDKPMQLGSRGVIPLPPQGDFKIVQMEPNGAVKEAMDQKEKQMAMLGAQLVEQQTVQRTLGEAQMERAVIESVLVQCAKNAAQAIQKALRWCALFYGAEEDGIYFELSTDFAITKLSPEERKQVLAEWQGGLTAFEEARNQLRQSGIAYLEDDKAKALIDQEIEGNIVDLDKEDEDKGNGDAGAAE